MPSKLSRRGLLIRSLIAFFLTDQLMKKCCHIFQVCQTDVPDLLPPNTEKFRTILSENIAKFLCQITVVIIMTIKPHPPTTEGLTNCGYFEWLPQAVTSSHRFLHIFSTAKTLVNISKKISAFFEQLIFPIRFHRETSLSSNIVQI